MYHIKEKIILKLMKAKSRSLIIVEYIRKCTMQTMELIMLEAGMTLRERERETEKNTVVISMPKANPFNLNYLRVVVVVVVCIFVEAVQEKIELCARIVNSAFSKLDLGVFYGAQSLAKLIKCLKFSRNNLIFVVISVIHTGISAIMLCSLCKHTSLISTQLCAHSKQSKYIHSLTHLLLRTHTYHQPSTKSNLLELFIK